jgi:iron complex outermembrane receptor protein
MLAESIEVLRGPATLLYGPGAIGGVVNIVDNRIPRARVEGVTGGVEYRYDEGAEMNSGVGRIEGGTGNFAFHFSGTLRDSKDVDIPGMAIDEAALEEQEELLGLHQEGHDEHDDIGGDDGDEHDEEEVENTNGYIANTDTEAESYTLGTSFHFGDEGFIGFSVSHLDTEYGIPPGAHGHHEDEEHEEEHEEDHGEEEEEEEEIIRIDLEQTRYDAMLHLHEPLPMTEVMRVFLTYTDYEHKELEGAEVGTRYERDTWEGRLELVHKPIGAAHGVLGLQVLADEFSAVGDEAYVPTTDSVEAGLFLLEDFHLDDLTLEFGLRGDYVERDPDAVRGEKEDFVNFSISGAALWDLGDGWTTGMALSRAERAPSTEELYSNIDAQTEADLVVHGATGLIEIGDAEMDEEVSQNVDLSLTWQGDRSFVQVAVFYNYFEDYIFLFNTGQESDETPIYQYAQEDADFYGLELTSDIHLLNTHGGDLSLRVTGDAIRGEFDESGDVPRLPTERIGASLQWNTDNLGAWIGVQRATNQDRQGEFETETDGYTRWDLGADYTLELSGDQEMLFFVKWKNFTDEEIRLSTSFLRNVAPEAGASLEAGLRYTF